MALSFVYRILEDCRLQSWKWSDNPRARCSSLQQAKGLITHPILRSLAPELVLSVTRKGPVLDRLPASQQIEMLVHVLTL